MRDDPILHVNRFYHFLSWVVDEYGLWLFMAFVFLLPFLVAWVLRWARKHPGGNIPVGTFRYGAPPPRDPYKEPLNYREENPHTWL